MKISVVTVCFNSARTIADTLRSVAAQDHSEVEHIVIDGGSTDGTLDVVTAEGAHVALVVSEPDRGIYDAMNKGLRAATGDVVGFLNSDDFYATPGILSQVADAMSAPEVDAVYGDLVFVAQNDVSKIIRYWRSAPHHSGACAQGWMPPHPTLYVRRTILDSMNGFDLAFKLQADFDLCLRLFELRKVKSRHLPETFVCMRMGGATTGSLRNIMRGNLEAERACRKHGFHGGLAFLARKMGSRIGQFLARPGVDQMSVMDRRERP